VRFCRGVAAVSRPLAARLGHSRIDAAILGSGPAIVMLNESDNDTCAWMSIARELSRSAHAVAVFRYSSTDAADEATSVREALAVTRPAGRGTKVQLVGASIGGGMVFEAAARAPHQVEAIVSLSGECRVNEIGDIRADVSRVRAPVLYLGTRADPFTEGTRQPRQLEAALTSPGSRFHLISGSEHGVDLLEDAALRAELTRFVAAHTED
jgi:dienelactone hydrolase